MLLFPIRPLTRLRAVCSIFTSTTSHKTLRIGRTSPATVADGHCLNLPPFARRVVGRLLQFRHPSRNLSLGSFIRRLFVISATAGPFLADLSPFICARIRHGQGEAPPCASPRFPSNSASGAPSFRDCFVKQAVRGSVEEAHELRIVLVEREFYGPRKLEAADLLACHCSRGSIDPKNYPGGV